MHKNEEKNLFIFGIIKKKRTFVKYLSKTNK